MKIASGYIALFSTIIIFLTLLVVSVAVNANGFSARRNVSEQELKRASLALAESCVQVALLKFARGDQLPSNEVIPVGTEFCTVVSVVVTQNGQNRVAITTQASFGASYTTIRAEFAHDPQSNHFTVVSWVEMP